MESKDIKFRILPNPKNGKVRAELYEVIENNVIFPGTHEKTLLEKEFGSIWKWKLPEKRDYTKAREWVEDQIDYITKANEPYKEDKPVIGFNKSIKKGNDGGTSMKNLKADTRDSNKDFIWDGTYEMFTQISIAIEKFAEIQLVGDYSVISIKRKGSGNFQAVKKGWLISINKNGFSVINPDYEDNKKQTLPDPLNRYIWDGTFETYNNIIKLVGDLAIFVYDEQTKKLTIKGDLGWKDIPLRTVVGVLINGKGKHSLYIGVVNGG